MSRLRTYCNFFERTLAMINPLLITRKENAGILRRICSELNAIPREMIGEDWSLAVFLKRDLKT